MHITTSTIINALEEFDRDIGIPGKASQTLEDAYKKLCEDGLFLQAVRDHLDGRINKDNINCTVKDISEKTDIHQYTAAFCLLIAYTPFMKKAYMQKGIDMGIYIDTVRDLSYKLSECYNVKGVWGTFVADWLYKYFQLGRFALGRLQTEIVPLGENYKEFTAETEMLKIHIPGSKEPLTQESIRNSIALAKEFFGKDFPRSQTVMCKSWLLYPGYEGVFKEGSNIAKFRSMFEIVKVTDAPVGAHPDLWRIFDMDYTGNIDDFPERTSLHRSFKEYVRNGGRSGEATGIFSCEDIKSES